MAMAFRTRRVQGEDSWICSACKSVVQNFILEDDETTQDYLQVLIVEPDEAMISLRETIGMEEEPPSVVDRCKHDRFFRRWCQQFRTHRNRIDVVSKIVDSRLQDLNECLDEWNKITREYEEAGNDYEKKKGFFCKVLEFRIFYRDMLTKEGPGADETFKKEMQVIRNQRDHLLTCIPQIRQGILDMAPPYRTQFLKVIKTQADRFEASGVQARPDEWTVVKFYNELKAACVESENSAIQNEPQGLKLSADKPQVGGSVEHSNEESDTLFVDTLCLLKMFSAEKPMPMTDERPSTSQAVDRPTQPAHPSETVKEASQEMTFMAQIQIIDLRIKKLEGEKARIVKSINKIRKEIGEVFNTETGSDEDSTADS